MSSGMGGCGCQLQHHEVPRCPRHVPKNVSKVLVETAEDAYLTSAKMASARAGKERCLVGCNGPDHYEDCPKYPLLRLAEALREKATSRKRKGSKP